MLSMKANQKLEIFPDNLSLAYSFYRWSLWRKNTWSNRFLWYNLRETRLICNLEILPIFISVSFLVVFGCFWFFFFFFAMSFQIFFLVNAKVTPQLIIDFATLSWINLIASENWNKSRYPWEILGNCTLRGSN